MTENELITNLGYAKYKVDSAFSRLMRQKSWLDDLGPIREEDYEIHAKYHGIERVGTDKEGRCIVFVSARNLIPDKSDAYTFIKYYYARFSEAAQGCSDSVDQYTVITDISGAGMENFSFSTYSQLFPCLNAILVDKLDSMILVNTNWVFDSAWAFAKRFQAKSTLKKIKIFREGSEEMPEFIQSLFSDPKDVPRQLGGPLDL